MASLGYSALGTNLEINTGTSGSPTWIPVAEIHSITQSGRQNATVSVTNFQSVTEEWVSTLPTSGSWALKGNYTSDAGRLALEAAFASRKLTGFKVILPVSTTETTTGDVFSFNALVESINYDLSISTAITFSASLKVSGTITTTVGS